MVVQHHFQRIMNVPPLNLILLGQRVGDVEILAESVGMSPNLIYFDDIVLDVDTELECGNLKVSNWYLGLIEWMTHESLCSLLKSQVPLQTLLRHICICNWRITVTAAQDFSCTHCHQEQGVQVVLQLHFRVFWSHCLKVILYLWNWMWDFLTKWMWSVKEER